ncbi:unnamed protein product, partial [Scytosiphon promiscuus]
MKRAYPAMKFVRPRPTDKPTLAASEKSFTPPLREAASVSPAVAKRKRPTTQSWKGPRRRLDPPSPSNMLLSKAGSAGNKRVRLVAEGRQGRAAQPLNSTISRSSRQERSTSLVASRSARNPATASAAASSRVTPDSPTTRRVHSRKKELVMVAGTPTRPTALPKPFSRRSTTSSQFGRQELGDLRIPDTPDPAVMKPDHETEGCRATGCHNEVEVGNGGSDTNSRCPSSLSCPIGPTFGRTQLEATSVADMVGSGKTPHCPQTPPSSSEDSDAGSESPDLLRSYPTGAKGKWYRPGWKAARGEGNVSSSSASAARRGVLDHSASERSDTGNDSPDLLRGYGSAGVEFAVQAGAVVARQTTVKNTSGDIPRKLPEADESVREQCRVQKAEKGHPRERESGTPRNQRSSPEGPKPAADPTPSLQAISELLKPQPCQKQPHPFYSSLDHIHDVQVEDSADSCPRLPPPARRGDGGTNSTVGKERGVAAKEGMPLPTGDSSDNPNPDNRAFHGMSVEGCAWRESKGRASAAPPLDSSSITQFTVSGAGGGEEKTQRGAVLHQSPRLVAASPTSARGSDFGLEGACCTPRLQPCTSKPPYAGVATTSSSGIGSSASSTSAPRVNQGVTSLQPRPARRPAAKDAGLISTGITHGHPTESQLDTSPRESLARRSARSVPNPYNTATKDAACPPAGVPSPHAGGVNQQLCAALRRSSPGVPRPHGAGDSSASVVGCMPNPYAATRSISQAPASATSASADAPSSDNAVGNASGFPASLESVSVVHPRPNDAMGASVRVTPCTDNASTSVQNTSRNPTLPAVLGQPTKSSPARGTRSNDAPQARTRREHGGTQLDGRSSSSDGTSSETPPEVRFEVARQELYKNSRFGTTRRD